jgi:hypothetical protein
VSFNFGVFPFLIEENLTLSTAAEFLGEWTRVGKRGSLGEVGSKRLEATVKQFMSTPDIQIAEGIFILSETQAIWVVARLRVPKGADGEGDPTRAVVLGGFSSLVSARMYQMARCVFP